MRVGIVGASGAVGLEIIKLLESRRFKLQSLSLFGSDNILNNDKKGFNYVKMLPGKVISAVKKSI